MPYNTGNRRLPSFGVETDWAGNPIKAGQPVTPQVQTPIKDNPVFNPAQNVPGAIQQFQGVDFNTLFNTNPNSFIAGLKSYFNTPENFEQQIATYDPANPTQQTPAGSTLYGYLSQNQGAVSWLMNYINQGR